MPHYLKRLEFSMQWKLEDIYIILYRIISITLQQYNMAMENPHIYPHLEAIFTDINLHLVRSFPSHCHDDTGGDINLLAMNSTCFMFIKFDLDISRVSRILSLGLARIISSWCFSCSLRSSLVMKMVWHLDHHHTSQTMKYHKTSNKIGHYWDSRKGSCLNLGKPCDLNPKISSHQSNTPTAETYIGRTSS